MIDAMKLALEALEYHQEQTRPIHKTQETITALRQAIEQAEKQEKLCKYCGGIGRVVCDGKCMPEQAEKPDAWIESVCALLRQAHDTLSLASLPTKREWVSLTDDEVHEAAIKCVKSGQSVDAAIRAIEAKLKEKNNG